MTMDDVRVGCAGWAYQDWVGALYPKSLPSSDWLGHYADLFSLVEIDSTFYALPAVSTVEGWVRRVGRHPRFRFAAKLSQDVTHRALAEGRLQAATLATDVFVERVVRPLEDADRFACVLVQLPPGFAYGEPAGSEDPVDALRTVLERLEPTRRRVAVEFRHRSWYEHVGETLVADAAQVLGALQACLVQVDGLGSRVSTTRTTPWSYFRFHGRRDVIPPSERGLSHAPYNYLYSTAEIRQLAAVVQRATAVDESTLVIFNNHYRAQAAHNAMDLMEALGQVRPRPATSFKRETRLDDYVRGG